MKPTSHRSVHHAVAGFAIVGLLALSACGSDDESSSDAEGGDTASSEEFCAQLGELAAGDGSSVVTDLQTLAESAPDAISDDMQAFANLFNEMEALSTEQTDEAAAQLADKIGEMGELTGRLDTWTNENCPDIPDNVFTEG